MAREGRETICQGYGTGALQSGDLTTADDPLLALDPCRRRSGISSLTSFASNKLGKSPSTAFSSVGIEGKEGGEVVEGAGASQSAGGRLRAVGSTAPSWMDDEVRWVSHCLCWTVLERCVQLRRREFGSRFAFRRTATRSSARSCASSKSSSPSSISSSLSRKRRSSRNGTWELAGGSGSRCSFASRRYCTVDSFVRLADSRVHETGSHCVIR